MSPALARSSQLPPFRGNATGRLVPGRVKPNDDIRSNVRQDCYVRFPARRTLAPVSSAISKWFNRHVPRPPFRRSISQSVSPWNVRFAQDLKEPAFAARSALTDKDARTLARDILAMSDEDFRTAFKGSPMKRAKLRGLKRNAAVVLGNAGTTDDVDVLTRALDDPEPLVRKHAEWALRRVGVAPSGPANLTIGYLNYGGPGTDRTTKRPPLSSRTGTGVPSTRVRPKA